MFNLLAFDKSSPSEEVYDAAFKELVQHHYHSYLAFYTDGSKK